MPAERVSMRPAREILRLKYECGASAHAIAVAVNTARSTVRLCMDRASAAGLSWPLPPSLTPERPLAALGRLIPVARRGCSPTEAASSPPLPCQP
jgi:hypothetical protein